MIRPDLRGAKAIAAHLGICCRTLWSHATRAHDPLPMFKFGGICVANRRELDAWMGRQLHAASAPKPAGKRRRKRRRVVDVADI